MKRFAYLFLLIWPFLWDNLTQAYHNAQIISFSKGILQLLEIALIGLISVYILVSRKLSDIDFKFISPFILLLVIGLISGILFGSDARGMLQVSYLLLRPFLIFFIAINLDLGYKELVTSTRFLGIFYAINILLVYFQFIVSGVSGDPAAGLLYHAHSFANIVAYAICFVLAYTAVTRRRWYLLLIPLLIPTIMIAAHEKTIVLLVPVFLVFYLLTMRFNLRQQLAIVLGIVIIFFSGYKALEKFSPVTIEVTELALENFNKLGFIRATNTLMDRFDEYPEAAIVGFGPGNYGSIYNTFSDEAKRRPRKAFAEEIYASTQIPEGAGKRLSVWAPRPNIYIAVWSEYGWLGFLLYLYVFFRLLRMHHLFYRSTRLPDLVRWLALGNLLSIVYMLLLGVVYVLTGYYSQSNIFPLMLIAGQLYATVREQLNTQQLEPEPLPEG